VGDELHLVQTKSLEFQKKAYSLSRVPEVLAYHTEKLIISAHQRIM
jgi:hypothetical protein